MDTIILNNIFLMLLLPFWIFLIIMCGRFFSVYVNKKIIYALTLFSSAFGILICSASILYIKYSLIWNYPFIKINNLIINCGLQVDKLSLILALILFIISFAVQIFSIHNLRDEKKEYRFFALLNLFNFGMGALLFSPNLFQMYVFWELIGIVSYLLIGFDYVNPIKSEASKRVLILNKIGDTALIAGIIITAHYMYSYVQNTSLVTLSFEDMNVISTLTLAYVTPEIFIGICMLFIIAAIVKSAQFPFYFWLQDAMEARTPVSALLHSATLVVLGVYLIIRILPFLTLYPILLKVIIATGVITSVICSVLASIEKMPKKILAYSTSANLGLMFTAIGLGSIHLAIIFLAFHAFVKSMLFILIPENKKTSYFALALFVIGTLSLAGLLFAGVGVKEMLCANLGFNRILYLSFLFVTFISAYYITRFAFITFKDCQFIKQLGITEISAFILTIMNIAIYVFLRGTYHLSEPLAAAIGGLSLGVLLYKNKKLEVVASTPMILEKFGNIVIPFIYAKFSQLLIWIEEHIISNYKPIIAFSKINIKFVNLIETNLMNKTITNIENIAKVISMKNKYIQSGSIQHYNAYGFILITIIVTLLIISCKFIIGQII